MMDTSVLTAEMNDLQLNIFIKFLFIAILNSEMLPYSILKKIIFGGNAGTQQKLEEN